MGIQAMFFGSISTSVVTAQSSVVIVERNGPSSAGIRFTSAGEQIELISSSQVPVTLWVTPASSASEWEIRATLNSGNTPTGSLGVWQTLATDREWSLSRSNVGSSYCTLTFEFRKVGGSSAEYTISGNSITVRVGSPL